MKRPRRRSPYLFEIIYTVNFILLLAYSPRMIAGNLLDTFLGVSPAFVCIGAGALVRYVLAARRGRAQAYLRIIRRRIWLIDSVRCVLAMVIVTHVYGWLKLLIPIFHPRLFDAQLFALDKALFGGISPTVFLLTLFSDPRFLRFIDWSYANIFFGTVMVTTSILLSSPSRRIRLAFTTSQTLLWLSGAWLYIAVPSLGPAFSFAEFWLAHGADLRTTQHFQALLMRNYMSVLQVMRGVPASVSILLGIAAFPSLHIAYQVFAALWMRRQWAAGRIVFAVCAFFIFLGSMITGWHYFVDGVGGVVLALASYVVAARLYHLRALRARIAVP